MICPNCSTEIHFHADVPKFLSAPSWEFWGNVSSPVGEVVIPKGWGRLQGKWETRQMQRAITCKSAEFVHFYVVLPDGSKSHRLAMITKVAPNKVEKMLNRKSSKWNDLFERNQ